MDVATKIGDCSFEKVGLLFDDLRNNCATPSCERPLEFRSGFGTGECTHDSCRHPDAFARWFFRYDETLRFIEVDYRY